MSFVTTDEFSVRVTKITLGLMLYFYVFDLFVTQ